MPLQRVDGQTHCGFHKLLYLRLLLTAGLPRDTRVRKNRAYPALRVPTSTRFQRRQLVQVGMRRGRDVPIRLIVAAVAGREPYPDRLSRLRRPERSHIEVVRPDSRCGEPRLLLS